MQLALRGTAWLALRAIRSKRPGVVSLVKSHRDNIEAHYARYPGRLSTREAIRAPGARPKSWCGKGVGGYFATGMVPRPGTGVWSGDDSTVLVPGKTQLSLQRQMVEGGAS